MTKPPVNPEADAALNALATLFWRAAVEQVEKELDRENTQPRIERLRLIRRVINTSSTDSDSKGING